MKYAYVATAICATPRSTFETSRWSISNISLKQM
jgi:hypothetical protein